MPSPKDHAAICNPTTPAVTTGRQGREVTEILECKSKCCFSYWNAWTLVFQEKNQRQKEYKNERVFFFVRSLMRYIGWLYKCTGSFLRKSEREKSRPSAITTPSQISPPL